MGNVEIITSRAVPLGGPRAMQVRRTLPQRARSLVGAWCFIDHYGPDDVTRTGGMDVPPHPHTGLATVSWLFTGEIEHRDSGGVHALVRPGELNLMTGGHGVAHSEVSTPTTTVLHGVQLWVALPDAVRDMPRSFDHHIPRPIRIGGATVRVLVGSLAGDVSPVPTHTPIVGAEIILEAYAAVRLDVAADFEHAILVDEGPVRLEGVDLEPTVLGYCAPGAGRLNLSNLTGHRARVMLLGGEPFTEPIVMWWNFIGRSHEEIVAFRDAWQAGSEQFGRVEGYRGRIDRLPAPAMPGLRIKPRSVPSAGGTVPPAAATVPPADVMTPPSVMSPIPAMTPPAAGDPSAWG